jgi:tetraacyldisaccharide 4'-kinase
VYGGLVTAWRAMPATLAGVGIPVVSIGSLAVGGTGKTPLCMWTARRYRDKGRRVSILSRGYRRKRGPSPLVVSDGRRILVDVDRAGDEPYMMARRLDAVGVIVGKDRLRSALVARDKLKADLLVLDDGFQERRLRHDVEVLCFDESAGAGNKALLPWGSLRESWSAVRRYHLVVVRTRAPRRSSGSASLPLPDGVPVFFYTASGGRLFDSDLGEAASGALEGRSVALVSGIAGPAGFEEACLRAGVDARVSIRFEDHHRYSKEDEGTIRDAMAKYGAERILTTEKDIWKLPAGLKPDAFVLGRVIEFADGEGFGKALDTSIGGEP